MSKFSGVVWWLMLHNVPRLRTYAPFSLGSRAFKPLANEHQRVLDPSESQLFSGKQPTESWHVKSKRHRTYAGESQIEDS